MNRNSPPQSFSASLARACAIGVALVVAGCGSAPPPRVEKPPSVVPEVPPIRPVHPGDAEFTVAASMNDTWNAVGQILVRLDGVTYETRAQMLGLYSVRYRDQQMLIITRGLVMTPERQSIATEVRATDMDGKPNRTDAAIELLDLLRRHLPAEIERVAAILN